MGATAVAVGLGFNELVIRSHCNSERGKGACRQVLSTLSAETVRTMTICTRPETYSLHRYVSRMIARKQVSQEK